MDDEDANYIYSPEKNFKLKSDRNISFEEIIAAIDEGHLLDIVEHPNPSKYSNQKMYIVQAKEYIYLIPFVKDKEGRIILKTIIPSRKAVKQYKEGQKYEKKNKTE